VISSLVAPEMEPSIYDSRVRGRLVQQAAERFQMHKMTVYKYLRKYWQRGKTRNALLPDYGNSGGAGKPKNAGEKKRGRPRKYGFDPDIGIGVNVDEEAKKIFRIAIARFYNDPKQNALTTAYDLMLKEFYVEDYVYEDNVRKPVLIPQEQLPSFRQFKYWFEKEKDIKKVVSARVGAKRYALSHRAVLGSALEHVIGPGSRYEIDATVADIYLISRYNRNWIIGRPIIYVVIDVFSRMITGVYVGLEGPSWMGAMMALTNAATNKVKFCREYGISINEEDWPCHHIPDKILGDRGEMESKMVETLMNTFHVSIENAASYRADWKGTVESRFRILQAKVKPFLRGYIDEHYRERGGKDYRLDAKLDIHQFTEIIIRTILYFNNHHYLGSYNREEMMVAEDVPAKPIELWKWGIQNRSGLLRSFPEELVKLSLMPAGEATITAKGILFKKLRYSCEKGLREGWFDSARNQTFEKLDVSFDPRNMNSIYIRDLDGRGFEKCFLLASQERYLNKGLEEIENLFDFEQYQQAKSLGNVQQANADLVAHIEAITSKAEEMTDAVKDDSMSNASKVVGIREHRGFEKDQLREEQAFELAMVEAEVDPQIAESLNLDSEPESLEYPSRLELLRLKRQERKNDRPE